MEGENHSGSLRALCKQLMEREREIASKENLYGSIVEKKTELDRVERSIAAGEERLKETMKEYDALAELKERRLSQMQDSFDEIEKETRMREEALKSISAELAVKEKRLALVKKLEERNADARRRATEDRAREYEAKERRFEGLVKDLELKEEFLGSRLDEINLIRGNVEECLGRVESRENSSRFRELAMGERELERRVREFEMREKEFESSTKMADDLAIRVKLDNQKSEQKPCSRAGNQRLFASRGTPDTVDLDCAASQSPHPTICAVIGKDPESIWKLIRRGEIVHAVRHICALKLTDKFSPVQLLNDYLDDAQSHTALVCKGRRSNAEKRKAVDRELASVEAAMECAKECDLGPTFPAEKYSKRISDLKKKATDCSKRKRQAGNAASAGPKSRPVFRPVVLPGSGCSPKSWSKPPRGVVKLNFGFKGAQESGCGFASVVARSHEGSVLGIWYRKVASPDPSEGNKAAAVGALSLAAAKGWRAVRLEGDSAEAVANLRGSAAEAYCVSPEANRFATYVCVWAAGSNIQDGHFSWIPMPTTLVSILESVKAYEF